MLPPTFKDMLDREWPDHPPFGASPQKALYGWMGLEDPVATKGLNDPWAHCGKWGQRVAWSIELKQPVLNVAGTRGIWYLTENATSTATLIVLVCTTTARSTARSSGEETWSA